MRQASRKRYWLITGSILVALLLLTTYVAFSKMTAHAGGVGGGVGGNIGGAGGGVSPTTTVNLTHSPNGVSTLTWTPGTKALTVTIEMTGLAPNSTHPAHIHQGVCTSNGAVIYPLNNVVANAAGKGASTTTIANIAQGIPASGWYVNIHNGPNLTPAEQFLPIACGNVNNSNTSLTDVQTLRVPLGGTNAADQDASGQASLHLAGKTLTVTVNLHGLVPQSSHAEHIHAGSCESQTPGSIIYMLNNLTADSNGNASATTVINNVDGIPSSGWYVNIHRSTDLSTQTGFDPIACGNVTG